jgi:formate dehydrogenase maturation protein FdhE
MTFITPLFPQHYTSVGWFLEGHATSLKKETQKSLPAGLYRLYVCEQCHKYIKAVDLRCSEPEVSLPLERIFTLDIDRQAEEKGYRPGHSDIQGETTN